MMSYEKALQRIRNDEKCKPNFCCCSIIGPIGLGATGSTVPAGLTGATGPTGGILNFVFMSFVFVF